ncbi:MAG: hypothetical protein ACXVCP_00255 [Bdellovibrio sp.]
MTKQDFMKTYSELVEHFGPQAFSVKRAMLLFDLVEELPASWWTALVHRMIRANDGRFDIDTAARTEIATNRGYKRLDDESKAWTNLTRQMSDRGFSETLQKFGAKSLWEAIEKQKRSDT